jgi:hypothetical protein
MVPGAEVSEVEITQLMEALQAEVKAMRVSLASGDERIEANVGGGGGGFSDH